MYKKIGILLLLTAVLVGLSVYVSSAKPQNPEDTRIKVAATFYPLAEFAQQVGGDHISVSVTTPAGAEPHDYEPTPQDIITIRSSRVFLLNGNGLDPWAEKLMKELAGKGVGVVRASDHVETIPSDPHFWLDPVRVEKIVDAIEDALAKADPDHANDYEKNADVYKEKLAALHKRYELTLNNCARRDIVVSHDAFNYPAQRYNINVISISGISPEEEPSAKQLAGIADTVRQKGIRYIFFETLISPKLAETIAKETGAETLVLNPIEGLTQEEQREGKNYVTEMEANLKNLAIAMECH